MEMLFQDIYNQLQKGIDTFKQSIQAELDKNHTIDYIWKQVNQLYILDIVESQIDRHFDGTVESDMIVRLFNNPLYKDKNIIEEIVEYIRCRTEYYSDEAETDSFDYAVMVLSENR